MALSDWQQNTIRFVLRRGGRIDDDDIEAIIDKCDELYWFAVSAKRMRDCPHTGVVPGDVCGACGTWAPYPGGVRPGWIEPGVECPHVAYHYVNGIPVCHDCGLDLPARRKGDLL